MRHIAYIAATALLLLLGTTRAEAQKERVVEQSRKPRPTWVGLSTADYLAVTETGNTLAEATEMAMSTIRQHIINSVAINISSNEVMVQRDVNYNDWREVLEDYSSVVMTEAAKLPYINNISISNAADVYWERIYTRATKSYRYEFSIRYPFSEQTRRDLVEQFLAIDNAKVEELERLKSEYETITDLDKINEAANSLEALTNYFFDITRSSEAEILRRNYRSLYARTTLEIEEQGEGYCIYSLRIGDRRVRTSRGAYLYSESALELAVTEMEDHRYKLTYNPEYASPKEINTIIIGYSFGGANLKTTIYFEAPKKR